jgi:predicted DNA-binding protein YlxM (UPF0122 family)
MDSKWSKIVKGLLNEEDYLEKQTKAFRKTRLTVIKQMQEELSIQEIAKLFKISRQRVYKIIEKGQ